MIISLAPLLVVRTSVQRDLTLMGDNLAERSGNVLVHKASNGLKRIVEDHARVLHRERQLLESTSLLLASKIEGVLYGHSHTAFEGSFVPSDIRMDDVLKDYFFVHMKGRRQPLTVDFKQVSLENGVVKPEVQSSLAPLLGKVKFEYPQLIMWIEMALVDGTKVVYPKVDQQRRMGGGKRLRTTELELQNSLSWSLPQQDPRTRRMVFRVTAPIRNEKGELQGNLTLVIPVDSVLHQNLHVSMFSDQAVSYLVQPIADPDQFSTRLRIVAQEQDMEAGRGHWQVPDTDQWLTSVDEEQFGIMTTGLLAGKPGVVGMPYKDGNALWAYASIDENRTSLLLVVPREDIVREAQAAREFVASQVDDHNNKMGYVVLVVAGLVLVIALLLSKLFTRNITELVKTVRRVAKGDFSIRATVRSADEIGQLGLAINKMVPELKERVAMKNHLEVAHEVQQNLLPSENPELAGLDIAATSAYCDETGGDYYGFIPRSTKDGDSLVVAVGDVSGHGFQAALMMASARAYLRGQSCGERSLNEVVSAVNDLMFEDLDGTGRFMTLFLMELMEDGSAQWVRAGHDPALLYDPATDTFEELSGDGLPLGVMADVEFDLNQRAELQLGQVIVVGTDGIWETQSESGELYGKDRLKALIRDYADADSAHIIKCLRTSLSDFRGKAGKLDDMTIAVLRVK